MSDLSFQVRAPLGLDLSTGERVVISNWSLKGIELPGTPDVLPVAGTLSIPFQGVDIRFPVRFRTASGSDFLEFDGLTGRQRETLAVFYRSILSGRMASTEDIITSLDTPVDLVPMEETEDERLSATAGTAPRAVRAGWNIAFYLALAVIVFGIVGNQVWTRLNTIGVGQARVEAPLVEHRAADGGYVDRVLVSEGQSVDQGQTLIVLSSPENVCRQVSLSRIT